MSSKHSGMGQKLSNIHCLVDNKNEDHVWKLLKWNLLENL